MKKIFLTLITMGFVQIMFSQTELCIVGEVHEERAYMNSDSVYNILLKIKPDVILIELDSTCFTIDFRFIYPLDSLEGNQNVGAEKYRLQYKVDLRPFDVSGRNEWYIETNYFDNQDNMWKDIFNLYKNNELSKRDKEDVDILLKVMNYNWMTVNSVRDLNEERMVKFLSLREKILYPKIVSIVENTEKLRHWVDFARIWETQWFERNAVMADNIKKIAKEYKNKRIVAFVGLEHKPGLLDLLKDSNDFVIREYWTY